jgi:hypothetical protein
MALTVDGALCSFRIDHIVTMTIDRQGGTQQ